MKTVKWSVLPVNEIHPGMEDSPYCPSIAESALNTFWTDFWFHIVLPVRAELAPTAVR